MAEYEYTAVCVAGGIGGGAYGLQQSEARLGEHTARFRVIGSLDISENANRTLERLTGAPTLKCDLHTVQPAEVVALTGRRRPDLVLNSSPCQGNSGTLGEKVAAHPKYQALNSLLLKCALLCVSTWDEPPPLLVFENVPRITTRSRKLIADVKALLRAHGYEIHDGFHNCGEIGDLAQNRIRYLLVARQTRARSKVVGFVHRPPRHRVRGCGEVIGPLPLPNDARAGRLHQLPLISDLSWLRLASIPAGGDHRDLRRLPELLRFLALSDSDRTDNWQDKPNLMGVLDPAEPAKTITANMSVTGSNTPAAYADPRLLEAVGRLPLGNRDQSRGGAGGVLAMGQASPCITASMRHLSSNTPANVADDRIAQVLRRYPGIDQERFKGVLYSPLAEGQKRREAFGRYNVADWFGAAPCVNGPGTNGAHSFADYRLADLPLDCSPRAGVLGVIGWRAAVGCITGSARIDNGAYAVADPRHEGLDVQGLPIVWAKGKKGRRLPIIIALDGTWHRPLTLLELAVLQGFPAVLDGQPLDLCADTRDELTEMIGNAIPPGAGKAIGNSGLKALLATTLGTWFLSSEEIWVQGPHREDLDGLDAPMRPATEQQLAVLQ